MKAWTIHRYGSPDVLDLTEIDKPVPGDDEALVRVRTTSANPYDWHNIRGEPFIGRLMGGGLGCAAQSSASWAPTWRGRSRRSART